jgi:hypothetical protein
MSDDEEQPQFLTDARLRPRPAGVKAGQELLSATDEQDDGRPSDGAPSSTPATASSTSPHNPDPGEDRLRMRCTDAGRLSTPSIQRQNSTRNTRPPTSGHHPRQSGIKPSYMHPRLAPRPAAANASADTAQPTPQSNAGPQTAAPASAAQHQHPGEGGHTATTELTDSGDAVVEVTRTNWLPAVVHISGNSASEYFAVRTLGTNNVLVMTMEPYDGIRPLDWDGDESTGFEIWATGPWRIEILPPSAIPTFTGSFNGNGNMVVHFTQTGSLVRITGNNERQHFEVRTLSAYGPYRRLVDTTRPHAGECPISRGPQIFDIQATGPWTITIK